MLTLLPTGCYFQASHNREQQCHGHDDFIVSELVSLTMSPIPISSEILGAMITPAVLISASGVLVLSTSNRVSRTVDRVRSLAAEVETLQASPGNSTHNESNPSKLKYVADQLAQLSRRALLLRSAMTALYSAIGLLLGTSILVGVVALLQWQYSSLPVLVGFAGACALLYGSLLLVREARLALLTTVEEVAFIREAALAGQEQKSVREFDSGNWSCSRLNKEPKSPHKQQ